MRIVPQYISEMALPEINVLMTINVSYLKAPRPGIIEGKGREQPQVMAAATDLRV